MAKMTNFMLHVHDKKVIELFFKSGIEKKSLMYRCNSYRNTNQTRSRW